MANKQYVNKGSFAFVEPETSTRFEPGEPAECAETDWVKAQLDAGVFEVYVPPKAEKEPPKT